MIMPDSILLWERAEGLKRALEIIGQGTIAATSIRLACDRLLCRRLHRPNAPGHLREAPSPPAIEAGLLQLDAGRANQKEP
jgi:hypothetical protein